MLVLTRKVKQQIQIGESIVITILQIRGQTVRVGIEAPQQVRVVRSEIAHLPAGTQASQPTRAARSTSKAARAGEVRVEREGGFSSPAIDCTAPLGESPGLYPFIRRRSANGMNSALPCTATTSSPVAIRR